jgi:hypothetical protein
MVKVVLENEFYYLDNFQRVLDWIGERYADLLEAHEHAFLATFPTLPHNARALFVRMVMRKGDLFRASKLSYAEIGCPLEAAQGLSGTGWIELDPELTLDELFDLLSKPEIAEAFGPQLRQKGARKGDQLEALRAECGESRRFSNWYAGATDSAWRILVKPLCERLRLLFFGNLRQGWTDFVLSDLGLFRYEAVEISPASRGFRQRADIDHYLALHDCKERFAAGEVDDQALHQILGDLPQQAFDNDWLQSRREKLVFQIGQHYEKQKDWDNAHATYARCRFPGARARAIRVLEKHERFDQAHALLSLAQAAPENEAERQHLSRIAPRLARRLGHARLAARAKPAVQRIDLCLPLPDGERWVEGAVREHLARADAPVFYVENALANTLFGLLCWRAVFAAIPGAFFHPFQRGPADLYSADFHQRRVEQFAACLAELDSGSYRDTILRNYHEKFGLQSPFVHWEGVSLDILALALDCIPAAHLRKWCERILADVKENRTGFPDLIQFWPAERRYAMIEVKGPGDRLQDNQLRWIEYCEAHAMPMSVCYLLWQQAPAQPAELAA